MAITIYRLGYTESLLDTPDEGKIQYYQKYRDAQKAFVELLDKHSKEDNHPGYDLMCVTGQVKKRLEGEEISFTHGGHDYWLEAVEVL